MSMGRPQQASKDHTRQHNVICVKGTPGYFAIRINFGPGGTNDMILAVGRFGRNELRPYMFGLTLTHDLPSLPMRCAAASTAS